VPVGHGGDQIAPVVGVVANARLLQERRVGGESLDPGLGRHLQDLRLVGAIGEQLYLEVGEFQHSDTCEADRMALRRDGLLATPAADCKGGADLPAGRRYRR